MKMFKCNDSLGLTIRDKTRMDIASSLGWEISCVGHAVLDQLEVGETTIDDDGDIWERVE